MATAEASDARSPLERSLAIVTEVKAGEGLTAVLLTLNVFLLLTAYYVIKPVREGLILAMEGGAEKKSYISAAIAVTLLFAVPAYSNVANKVAKHKLVVGVTLFFAAHLLVFWVLSHIPPVEKELGLVFFTWVGVFNMMVVAQFWGFANDLYTQEQGKRLFAMVGIGASFGSAVGAYVTKFLKDTLGLGVYQLLLVAGGLLALSAFITHVVHRREEGNRAAKEEAKAAEKEGKAAEAAEIARAKQSPEGGFTLVLHHRYLMYLAAFMFVFTIVDTNGEYILSVLVEERAAERAAEQGLEDADAKAAFAKGYIAGYYGSFYLWVNLIGLFIQTFLVSRIVKLGGLKLAFIVYPLIALTSSLNLILIPGLFGADRLSVFRPGKTAENATDYSLNNTVRNMLWLPTTTEMKYKAKQAVDTFFVRMGDVASAGIVFFFGSRLAWPVRNFSIVNVVLVAVWLLLSIGILRENARLARLAEEKKERASAAT
ncbi:MAG: hypothetical protein KIT84_22545 [Labilithrix sp.]|nr:hypothetical protein [Labilithrix sp.]MCW5813824.1 hypothetical protein [Labilithrix sp.]